MFLTEDLDNLIFIKTILLLNRVSFLVQNFNPVNLDIKLDSDKEKETVKFLWGECIPVILFSLFININVASKLVNQV